MQSSSYDHFFKILLIGNSEVGKTSLLLRFANSTFDPNLKNTVGTDYRIKTIEIKGKIVKLQIWDTAGQEKQNTISESYYKMVHGIIITYNISDRSSFENVENWVAEMKKYSIQNVVCMLVGNKSDLIAERMVTIEEGQQKAKQFGLDFFQTSAKTNTNVDEAFMNLAIELLEKYSEIQVGGEAGAT